MGNVKWERKDVESPSTLPLNYILKKTFLIWSKLYLKVDFFLIDSIHAKVWSYNKSIHSKENDFPKYFEKNSLKRVWDECIWIENDAVLNKWKKNARFPTGEHIFRSRNLDEGVGRRVEKEVNAKSSHPQGDECYDAPLCCEEMLHIHLFL